MKMNEILKLSLLYDFYGELLTAHQRKIYGQYLIEDLSLGEIAESEGITRQGVHDIVKRCQKKLESYEERLHLVERFWGIREKVEDIHRVLNRYESQHPRELIDHIRLLSEQIMDQL